MTRFSYFGFGLTLCAVVSCGGENPLMPTRGETFTLVVLPNGIEPATVTLRVGDFLRVDNQSQATRRFQDRFGTTECAPIGEVGSLPPGGAVTVGPFVRVAACVIESVSGSGHVASVLVVE